MREERYDEAQDRAMTNPPQQQMTTDAAVMVLQERLVNLTREIRGDISVLKTTADTTLAAVREANGKASDALRAAMNAQERLTKSEDWQHGYDAAIASLGGVQAAVDVIRDLQQRQHDGGVRHGTWKQIAGAAIAGATIAGSLAAVVNHLGFV